MVLIMEGFGLDDVYTYAANGTSTAVASNTSLTIGTVYQGATATGQEYILRQIFYSLSTSADDILDVRQYNSPRKLQCFGYRAADTYRPNFSATGFPVGYYKYRLDPEQGATADKKWQITLEPSSSQAMVLEVRTKKILGDFAATNGNISQIPVRWHIILLDGAEAMGRLHLNDPGFKLALERYENGLARAMAEDRKFGDRLPIMGGLQDTPVTHWLPFPSNYEQPR